MREARYRIEHRPPGEPPRVLDHARTLGDARMVATYWASVLVKLGERGEIRIVVTRSGTVEERTRLVPSPEKSRDAP